MLGSLLLVLAGSIPARAAVPDAPWIVADIGKPGKAGSTSVDANGVWTQAGGGRIRYTWLDGTSSWPKEDRFHFAYRRVKGDAILTARFQGALFPPNDVSAGMLMVRQDDTPGSPGVTYAQYDAGIQGWARLAAGKDNRMLGPLGPFPQPWIGLQMRLQRSGNEVAGYYSFDGNLWWVDFDAVTLPTLSDEALIGLGTYALRGTLTTLWDRVNVQSGAIMAQGITSTVQERKIRLTWEPVKEAVGYAVYRGPGFADPSQLRKLTSDPLTEPAFVDEKPNAPNGQPMTYAIAAVLRNADGTTRLGPRVATAVTPAAVPAPWQGANIHEGVFSGAAAYDSASDQFTLKGFGPGVMFTLADGCYFVHQQVEGDAQITARLLSLPAGGGFDAPNAGLTIRESLQPGARCLRLGIDANPFDGGMYWQARKVPDALSTRPTVPIDALSFPLTLRLTRQGTTLTAAYLRTDGTFQVTGVPVTFDPPLSPMLDVGMHVTGGNFFVNRWAAAEARFDRVSVGKP
jgi:hypothetical protein